MNIWNQSVHSLLNKIRLNSIMLASKHIKNHLYFLNCSKYFERPVIMLVFFQVLFQLKLKKLCIKKQYKRLHSLYQCWLLF
jgi:hypothetical protein